METIYPVFKDGEFSTVEAANMMGASYKNYGSTMGSLAIRGIIERCNGEKRSHYASRSGPPTMWRFTERFRKWYEGRYLESQ